MDVDSRLVKREFERRGEQLQTTLFRYRSNQMVVMYSTLDRRTFAWDLSMVPGAFDATARLEYADVAAHVRPLHPVGGP
jgi:hypothetical protein